MLRYDYAYKYSKCTTPAGEVIIELSVSNMLGKICYSAKSNLLFRDKQGCWGHACGVGDNEEKALNMCCEELEMYLGTNSSDFIGTMEEVLLPQKITFCYSDTTVILYAKVVNQKIVLLTNSTKEFLSCDNVLEYLRKNYKKYLSASIANADENYLRDNDFYPTFDSLFKKVTCSMSSHDD